MNCFETKPEDVRPRREGHGLTKPWPFRALLLSAGLCLAAPAIALESGPLIQGSYEIETWFTLSGNGPFGTGCMIIGNSGASASPSLYRWPVGGAHCGLNIPHAQATWDIYPIVSGQTVRHVIKSRVNGKCLIRAGNGRDINPSLYLWPEYADKHFCGLPDANALIINGQAAWDFTGLEAKVSEVGDVVYAGSIRLGGAALIFSPLAVSPPPDYSMAIFTTDAEIAGNWRMNLWSALAKPIRGKAQ